MTNKEKSLKNSLKLFPKEFETVDQVNRANNIWLDIYKERFKARTGKKNSRGFSTSKEASSFMKYARQRERRFKTRAVDLVESGNAVFDSFSNTSPMPFWAGIWKGGNGEEQLKDIIKEAKSKGDFVSIIKKVRTDANGNQEVVSTKRSNTEYDANNSVNTTYRELRRERDEEKKKGMTKYYNTFHKVYEIGDLTIIETIIDLDD